MPESTSPAEQNPLNRSLTCWKDASEKNPFDTWLILENSDAVKNARELLGASYLDNHITTLKGFAKAVIRFTHPEITLLNDKETLILFSSIAKNVRISTTDTTLPLSFINELIGFYTYKVSDDISFPQPLPTEKHKNINTIITRYEQWLAENNCIDTMNAMKMAADILKSGEYKPEIVIICGITPQTKAEQDIIAAISDTAKEIIDPETKPDTTGFTCPKTLKPENILCYRTAEDEIRAVLDKCASLIESGVKPDSILILTPSVNSTISLLEDIIPEFYCRSPETGGLLPLQYTSPEAGKPLMTFPVAAAVTAVMEAAVFDFSLESLQQIVSSPYFTARPGTLTPGSLALISAAASVTGGKKEWLAAKNALAFRNVSEDEEWRFREKRQRFASSQDLDALIEWIEKANNGKTFADRAGTLRAWLNESGWTAYPLSGADLTARKRILAFLDTLSSSKTGTITCTASEFNSHLARYSQAIRIPEYIDPVKCIRVAKVSSGKTLTADYVFIINLTSNAIPAIQSTRPPFTRSETEEMFSGFMNRRMQSEREGFAGALLCAEKELRLSCAKSDARKNTTPSSFMTEMGEPKDAHFTLTHSMKMNRIEAGKAINLHQKCDNPVGLIPAESVIRRIQTETDGVTADFSNTELVDTFAKKYTEDTEYAPTTLEEYIQCPYKWYLEKHLRLFDPGDISSETLTGGTIVHDTLERFIREYHDPVTEETRGAALAKLFEICRELFGKKSFFTTPSWKAVQAWYLGENNLPSPFEKFIDWEIECRKEGWTSSADTVEVKISAPVQYDGKTMKVGGRIDRVLVRDDSFRIVDYKTGVSHRDKMKEGKLVQIPLYSEVWRLMHGGTPDGCLYLTVSPHNKLEKVSPFDGKKKNEDGTVKTVEDVTAETIEKCFTAVSGMQNGVCSPQKDCKDTYCPYAQICRKAVSGGDEE